MALPNNSERKQFSSTIDKNLYEKLQNHSKETGVPISRLLDRAVEELLDTRKFKISDRDLYSYLVVYFGTKGLDVDTQIESILRDFVQKQLDDLTMVMDGLKNDSKKSSD